MNKGITYKGVIYLYTFPNGKVYVGQTRRDPYLRHKEHLDPRIGPTNSAFWKAYLEQGEPKFEIIETWQKQDLDELSHVLNEREEYIIRLYQATNPDKGYNLKLVGDAPGVKEKKLWGLTYYFTQQYIEEIKPIFDSVVRKLKHVERMTEDELELYHKYFEENNVFHGVSEGIAEDADFWDGEEVDFAYFILEEDMKVKAEDYVHENATVLLDLLIDEHTVYQLNEDGSIKAKFDSQLEAAMAMGAKTAANINNVLRCKQKMAYGYKWVYAIQYHENNKTK